jgi:hypothetical protein
VCPTSLFLLTSPPSFPFPISSGQPSILSSFYLFIGFVIVCSFWFCFSLFLGPRFLVSGCCCISSRAVPFIHVRLTRPPGGSKRDAGEASGGRLEPIPLLNATNLLMIQSRTRKPTTSGFCIELPILASVLLLLSSISGVVRLNSPNGRQ